MLAMVQGSSLYVGKTRKGSDRWQITNFNLCKTIIQNSKKTIKPPDAGSAIQFHKLGKEIPLAGDLPREPTSIPVNEKLLVVNNLALYPIQNQRLAQNRCNTIEMPPIDHSLKSSFAGGLMIKKYYWNLWKVSLTAGIILARMNWYCESIWLLFLFPWGLKWSRKSM